MSVRAARSDGLLAGGRDRPLSPRILGDLMRVADVAVIVALGLGVYGLYLYPAEPHTLPRYLGTILAAALVAGILFNEFGVYAGDFVFTRALRAERMISAWAVTFAILLAIAFSFKISTSYSRVWAVGWFASTGITLGLLRFAVGQWVLRLGQKGRFANRTAIVGTGPQAHRLAAHLRAHDAVRTRILGLVATEGEAAPEQNDDTPMLGGVDDLVRLIRTDGVDQVFVALPWNAPDRLHAVLQRLTVTPVTIRLAPDLAGFDFAGREFADVAGLPVLPLFDRPISEWSYVLKIIEDRIIALAGLILLGLPMLAIAALVRLDSPGPVLFKQRREGFNNATFEVWKFRTMYQESSDPAGECQATQRDPRVTRVGRFLRRTSLDELPQIFNVLRGEMSLVGPRPHAIATQSQGHRFEDVVRDYAARHRVKPGITGWAQVNGWRGETNTVEKLRKRVEYDLYYIDNWSIWLDLLIIAKTMTVPFGDKNAY
jgi:Undecaprenyl-phosphate glucose phosphotransferase